MKGEASIESAQQRPSATSTEPSLHTSGPPWYRGRSVGVFAWRGKEAWYGARVLASGVLTFKVPSRGSFLKGQIVEG